MLFIILTACAMFSLNLMLYLLVKDNTSVFNVKHYIMYALKDDRGRIVMLNLVMLAWFVTFTLVFSNHHWGIGK
jgi:hypothetical protein